MYGFFTKLLLSKRLKFEEGKIVLFDQPCSFVPLCSIKQMTDDAIKKGKKAINDLYFYGWVYGYVVTREVLKSYGLKTGLKSFEDRYTLVMQIASACGFGDYETYTFKVGDARFKVIKNPFGLQYYPSKLFVDHYLRGMNAGGGSLVHELLVDCIEIECTAVNGEYCNFINASRETLKKFDKKLVALQLDLNYLIKREKKLIESCGDKLNPDFTIKCNRELEF